MSEILKGGCLCGAVRYEVTGTPEGVTHCHCSMCRKASGAAFITWVTVRPDRVVFTRGQPTTYRSSPRARRGFCRACGSPLTFELNDEIDVTAGSLDEPNAIEPADHIWTSSRLRWLRMEDGLPRHAGEREGHTAAG